MIPIIIIHNLKTKKNDFTIDEIKLNSRWKQHQVGNTIVISHNNSKYCYYINNITTEYTLNSKKSIVSETVTYYCLPVQI